VSQLKDIQQLEETWEQRHHKRGVTTFKATDEDRDGLHVIDSVEVACVLARGETVIGSTGGFDKALRFSVS
jgi:hypothetical protein